jgi:hypothetical protein
MEVHLGKMSGNLASVSISQQLEYLTTLCICGSQNEPTNMKRNGAWGSLEILTSGMYACLALQERMLVLLNKPLVPPWIDTIVVVKPI